MLPIRFSLVPRVRAPAAALAAAAALLLAACAGGPDADDTAAARQFRTMAEIAYKEIAVVYIAAVPPRRLTRAGLAGLADLAPDLAVALGNGRAVLRDGAGDTVAEADLPRNGGPEAWAALATELVLAARADVPALAEPREETLYDAFFSGMMGALDSYSRYAGRKAARDARAEREGFGGIGVDLEPHPDGARIAGVHPGRPGAAAGLLAGDRIVAIDGAMVGGLPLRAIRARLRGPVDESVELNVARPGLDEPIEITVGRTRIVPDTVRYTRRGRHAVIRISSFNQRTAKRLAEAIGRARSDDAAGPLSGIVLDLRGNPGGLLDQAVDSADLFLESGLISRAEGRHPHSRQRFAAEPGDLAAGLRVVVLINGASASAAEVLAAALQDRGRAAVVGMTSFGKGSIQTVINLPNAGEMYLTWARLHAPSGYPLERLGVAPTICTAGARDAVQALDRGLDARRRETARQLARRRQVTLDQEAAVRDLANACAWRPHEGGDIDSAVAHLLIESPALYERTIALGRAPAGS